MNWPADLAEFATLMDRIGFDVRGNPDRLRRGGRRVDHSHDPLPHRR